MDAPELGEAWILGAFRSLGNSVEMTEAGDGMGSIAKSKSVWRPKSVFESSFRPDADASGKANDRCRIIADQLISNHDQPFPGDKTVIKHRI